MDGPEVSTGLIAAAHKHKKGIEGKGPVGWKRSQEGFPDRQPGIKGLQL
jgi:hypothetical protein